MRRPLEIPASATKVELTLGNRAVALTNLDKVFWPESAIKKRDLLQYYADISPIARW
jgi:DNA primase